MTERHSLVVFLAAMESLKKPSRQEKFLECLAYLVETSQEMNIELLYLAVSDMSLAWKREKN